MGWSESKLSRIETAATTVRDSDLDRLLDLYAVPARERSRLATLAGQGRHRGWWEAYGDVLPTAYEALISFESEAASISVYEAQLVPGLLQTAEYANAVTEADRLHEDPEDIGQRVAVRMARQAVLGRNPPPQFRVVLDEAVLRRPIGGVDVLRRQLLRLVEAGDRPSVTVQVLPFSIGAHRGLSGSFNLLDFPSGDEHSLVYCEGMTGGVLRSKPEEVRSYRASFEALRAVALNPAESLDLIGSAARNN
jgi:hypothetical protein